MLHYIISIISAIIALLAFITSWFHWLSDRIKERPNIKLEALGYLPPLDTNHSTKYAIFRLILNNLSTRDIAVTRIFLVCDNEKIEFCWRGDLSIRYFNREYPSTSLPIHILGMSACGGYFFLEDRHKIDIYKLANTPFTIVIKTSRGREKNYHFEKIKPMLDL